MLIVDPRRGCDETTHDLVARGVHVTIVPDALDALIEVGRCDPIVVAVASDIVGLSATQLIEKLRTRGMTTVIAILSERDASDAGPLMLAGATAAIMRPYTDESLWQIIKQSVRDLDDNAVVTYGPIELDPRAYTVRVDGVRTSDLPLKEFEILRVLLQTAPGILLDHDLRKRIWDGAGPADNTIAVHIVRLRQRLDGVAHLRRVRGRGYSLTLDGAP